VDCDLWVEGCVLLTVACVLWVEGCVLLTVACDLWVAAVLEEDACVDLWLDVAVVVLRVVLLALAAWLVADDLVFTEGELLLWLSCVTAGLASLLRVPCVLA